MRAPAADEISLMLRAINDPASRQILHVLKGHNLETCAGALVDYLSLSQPTVSHHLKLLAEAGLLTARREGLHIWYARDEKSIKRLKSQLDKDL